MKLTLTYRGELPPSQRGISSVKAGLRKMFHPQIKEQLRERFGDEHPVELKSTVGGYEFVSPAHTKLRTAVEMDVLLLSHREAPRAGDPDNRLKTLIDGLTRPANPQQLEGFCAPPDGGPTYCLMDDDKLVSRVTMDSRRWFEPSSNPQDVLVVITASIVLGHNVDMSAPIESLFMVI